MLSKAKIKFVQSLADKKHRIASCSFIVEGNKNVDELLRSKIGVKMLFTTDEWLNTTSLEVPSTIELIHCTHEEIQKVAFSKTPQQVVAVAELPEVSATPPIIGTDFVLALDTIQDPGNLGTIIRIADWYKISTIICSPGCADWYSPKVIQSTMGSFTRVQHIECDLKALFENNKGIPVYGAVMKGNSVYETDLQKGILLIGNEGQGIHPDLQHYITHPVTIPRVGGAESLNAAIATAIICDNRARANSR